MKRNLLKLFKKRLERIFGKYWKRDKIDKFPVFYINGSQTLPPPLNVLEEEKLLEKLSNNQIINFICDYENLETKDNEKTFNYNAVISNLECGDLREKTILGKTLKDEKD